MEITIKVQGNYREKIHNPNTVFSFEAKYILLRDLVKKISDSCPELTEAILMGQNQKSQIQKSLFICDGKPIGMDNILKDGDIVNILPLIFGG